MGFIKEEARKLHARLPDEASCDDIMYEVYVCKKIDKGIKAANEGKLVSYEEVKKRFIKNEN
jgi:predicted transcriptional regulator